MIFKRGKTEEETSSQVNLKSSEFQVIGEKEFEIPSTFVDGLISALKIDRDQLNVTSESSEINIESTRVVVSVFLPQLQLSILLEKLHSARQNRKDGFPIVIVCCRLDQLTDLGHSLYAAASSDKLSGIRLIVAETLADILPQIADKIEPIIGSNVVKMPASPEVDCQDYKYFYAITPQLRQLTYTMRRLAENGVNRIYILGGPGTGKTSIAYYYYLSRTKGNFVAVNLTSESTENKEAMKSLLCGHVAGSIAGSGAREGVLSYAGEGVAFLDESHGVTGVVMQVLMEVLDSGQFLPFGATKKRALQCAVVFASNRSWETLRSLVNLDEHARLGATIVEITDLATRKEDMIAVLATTLARFSKQCTSWIAPVGFSPEAWKLITDCPWRGNTRTLIRVTEASAIEHCLSGDNEKIVSAARVREALDLWEPAEHASHKIYTSFR